MKVGSAQPFQKGSFGIPPEIDPELVKSKMEDRKKPEAVSAGPQVPAEDDGFDAAPTAQGDSSETREDGPKTPAQAALKELTNLGVEMSPEDWSNLFFKGYVEKTITVAFIPDPVKKTTKPFTVTVRTLTAEENDVVDSLLAADTKSVEMTLDGFNNRKQMWSLACALQKINNMPVCKPKFKEVDKSKDRVIDIAATVKEKRKIISNMAPAVLSQAAVKYWTFVFNIEVLLSQKDGYFLDKP